jgi:hypothetical protein
MIFTVCSLNSLIKTGLFSDMGSGSRNLGNPTGEPAKSNDTVMQIVSSYILTPQVKAKNLICKTLQAYLWSCIERLIEKTDCVKLKLGELQCSSLLCSVPSVFKTIDALLVQTCKRRIQYHHFHFYWYRLPIAFLWVNWNPLQFD